MDFGGYMRVSRQGDRDPDQWLTVPAQRRAIEAWAAAQGHRVVDLREDIDVSGAQDDRPNLEALVAQVEQGELAGLVVAKVDRFSRDLAYGAAIARRIERAGGTFVAADDGVIIGPTGRDFGGNDTAHFLFAQLLSMADFFRRRNVQGWREVRERHVLERGRHWGYAPPFGYDVGDDGRLTPNDWAPYVTEAFERRARGEGASTIARWLDGLGARSARGGHPTHRWVRDILGNRVYLGEARAGTLIHTDAHPALVDNGLFLTAASVVSTPQRRSTHADAAPVLTGLVRCWACRTVMTGAFLRYQGGMRRVYRCRGRHAQGRCPGPANGPEGEILGLLEPVFWRALGGDLGARPVQDTDGAGLEERVTQARRDLELYRDATDLAGLDATVFADGLRKRQVTLHQAQEAFNTWQRQAHRHALPITGLRESWPSLPPVARGQLIGQVFGAIVIQRSPLQRRGQEIPLSGRTAALLLDDMPTDLPRSGKRPDGLRPFPALEDETLPWILLS